MSFIKLLKETESADIASVDSKLDTTAVSRKCTKHKQLNCKLCLETVQESDDSVEKILRKEGFKIKSVYGTKFGTEFIMFKKFNEEEVQELLKKYTLKFDGKSIFVVQ